MKIYLADQTANFPKHLEVLKSARVMAYDRSQLKEKVSSVEIATSIPFEKLNTDFLFEYKIFPSNILVFLTQWENEKRKMQPGDTIVQQVFIPPVKKFSQKLIFGVRIKEIIDEPARKGFSYETLEGHVEKGISTFTVEQEGSKIIFKIQTFSGAGNFLAKLMGPIFSTPYQTFCTNKALENCKRQIEASPSM
jgi:hypothetical protein